MKHIVFLMSVLIIAAATLFLFNTAEAKPTFVKGEKCSTCHVKSVPKKGDSELNAVGKCYQKTQNLDECKKK